MFISRYCIYSSLLCFTRSHIENVTFTAQKVSFLNFTIILKDNVKENHLKLQNTKQ